MKDKLIYVDLDDTIADFTGHEIFKSKKENLSPKDVYHMYEPGFFLSLKPIQGAFSAVRALIRMGYDVHILTQPVAESAHSYLEKVQWVGKYFPELINKIHMTQDKGLFLGGYLIDDNKNKWKDKFEANGGEFIHFEYFEYRHKEMWECIIEFFKERAGQ